MIESWSGYFRPTDPTGEQTLDVGMDADDDAYASVFAQVPRLAKVFRKAADVLRVLRGRADPRFVSDNVQLDRQLTAAHVRHVFDVYPGGHDGALWERHAVRWLGIALNQLAAPAP